MDIESPDEAPQFPLSDGWWRFVVISGPRSEDRHTFQVKNAGKNATTDKASKKEGIIIAWLRDMTKAELSSGQIRSVQLAIGQLTRKLGTSPRT